MYVYIEFTSILALDDFEFVHWELVCLCQLSLRLTEKISEIYIHFSLQLSFSLRFM